MTTAVDSPIAYDAAWFTREDKTLTFTVYVPGTALATILADDGTNPAIRQDITGWSLGWELRLSRYAATALLSKATSGNGITISTQSGTTKGQFVVAVASADTANMKAGDYYHGAARTNAGSWDVIAEGAARLRKAAIH